ncbi:MAG: D-alanyl-D-alanine carboxypeptidase, partial [Candidatus Aureabacteria bacterium]|nr:D-alanyl-D-alanine carboxypeptidase [Candidatus Auribacterota bacterium]
FMKTIRMKKFLFFLWLYLAFPGFNGYGEEKAPPVHATSFIVIDAETGAVLYERNADKKLYPASITKILTGYLGIVKGGDLDQKITVSRKAAYSITPGSSTIALKPEEIFPYRDVLYGLMLRSANECGNVIAEHVSGSNEAFASLMNETVKRWGMNNSHFVNPHGLHNDKHVSTARDMAFIAMHAMKNPVFREIVRARKHPFPDTNKHKAIERGVMYNKNKMLHPGNDEYYGPCIGIKAGYTRKSLHTFVAVAEKNGHTVIVALLKAPNKETMYKNLAELMEYGLRQYEKRILVNKDDVLLKKKLKHADKELSIVAAEALEKSLPRQLKEIEKDFQLKSLRLPVRKGDDLGKVIFYAGDNELGMVPLIAANTAISCFSWEYLLRILFSIPVLTGTGLVIALYLFLLGRKREKKYRRRYYR